PLCSAFCFLRPRCIRHLLSFPTRRSSDLPSDNPPYAFGGWPADEAPEVQQAMWWSGLEAATKIHRADWRALGLQALDRGSGRPGAERQLAWLTDYLGWITPTLPKFVDEGLAWLAAHEPPPTDAPALCWG